MLSKNQWLMCHLHNMQWSSYNAWHTELLYEFAKLTDILPWFWLSDFRLGLGSLGANAKNRSNKIKWEYATGSRTASFCVWALLTWAIEEVLQRMQPRGKIEIGSRLLAFSIEELRWRKTVDFDQQQVLLLLIGRSKSDYLGRRAPLLPPDYSFTRVNFLGPKVFWRKPLCNSKFIQVLSSSLPSAARNWSL